MLANKENCIRIPMIGDVRSLNLGNSVAVVLYEALRQNNFQGMNLKGELHHHNWDEMQ
jgi:tRNA (cytidine/uridine-2'-O-)-methyltransferase